MPLTTEHKATQALSLSFRLSHFFAEKVCLSPLSQCNASTQLAIHMLLVRFEIVIVVMWDGEFGLSGGCLGRVNRRLCRSSTNHLPLLETDLPSAGDDSKVTVPSRTIWALSPPSMALRIAVCGPL